MSWKPEVIADNTGKWYDNALRFATKEEAEASASDLAMRWLAVRDWRAVECEDPVTHAIVEGRMVEAREWPWCKACGSWHHPDNPTCVLKMEEGA